MLRQLTKVIAGITEVVSVNKRRHKDEQCMGVDIPLTEYGLEGSIDGTSTDCGAARFSGSRLRKVRDFQYDPAVKPSVTAGRDKDAVVTGSRADCGLSMTVTRFIT